MSREIAVPSRGRSLLASTLVLATSASIVASAGPDSSRRATPDASAQRPADMVLLDGKISMLDDANRTVSALAITDGRIVQVAQDETVRKLAGKGTEVVDLDGRRVLPA